MSYPWTAGEVLTAADLNAYAGLVLVKTQTVGTSVASVTVSSAFSSTFENYYITYTGGTMSGANAIAFYFTGTNGNTGWYYHFVFGSSTSNAVNGDNGANQSTFIYAGGGDANLCVLGLWVYQPNLALRSRVHSNVWYGAVYGNATGLHDYGTAYTGFVLDPAGAETFTGGTIRVYGYNNG